MKCTIQNTGGQVDDPEVHVLRNAGTSGLSKERNAICTGQNSGYQAAGIAIAAGARRLVLLGYDMRYVDGRSHWHKGHKVKVPEGWYKQAYTKHFDALADCGVEIINATPDSNIKRFPFRPIEEALA